MPPEDVKKLMEWGWVMALIYAPLMCGIACFDKDLPDKDNKSWMREFLNEHIVASLLLIAIGLWTICAFVKPHGWLDDGEPYALLEGVSMWPSQAIQLVAFILAGYFIIDAFRFPTKFTNWLEKNFCLRGIGQQTTARQLEVNNIKNSVLLGEWLKWKACKPRCWFVLVWGSVFYIVSNYLLQFHGLTHVPYRGHNIFLLNQVQMIGLLIPAFSILLCLVSDAAIKAVHLVELCFPDDLEDDKSEWPKITLWKYAARFNLQGNKNDAREWVGMRFIVELSKHIYDLIGYPLIIALLIVSARSSYFDNWQMPMALKLIIGFSMGWLLYWDHRLKKAVDKARANALNRLKARVICCQRGNQDSLGEQLQRLIIMIKNYDEAFYKSFTQRPIFLGILMIMIAILADWVDYATLASKLFQG